MRIAVYAIALNEAAHVGRFLETVRDADMAVVADTGSTDGTVAALRAGGVAVHAVTVRPWRFDDARNASLALVPANVDICIAMDLDEVLSPGWRDLLEEAWTPATTAGRYRYVTSHLPGGAPGTEVVGYKIHARFGYRWKHLCHEALVPDRITPVDTLLPGVRVDHWPDMTKNRSQYLPLLQAAVAEEPGEPRHLFLLGREFVDLRRWAEAEPVLRRYLQVVGERFPYQRAAILRHLYTCRAAQSDPAGAERCLNDALQAAPDLRDVWLDLADFYAGRAQWRESYAAATRGLGLDPRTGPIGGDHANAGGRPYWRASVAAWRLGRLHDALALAAEAHAREPDQATYAAHQAELLRLVNPA